MFSLSPFSYEYHRPRYFHLSNYEPLDGFMLREEPSLFRSYSYRLPSTKYYQPYYHPVLQKTKKQSNENEDEYDPLLELFGLRTRKPSQEKDLNSTRSNNEMDKNQVNESSKEASCRVKSCKPESTSNQDDIKSSEPEKTATKTQAKCSVPQNIKEKELDSKLFETDNDVEYRFCNYECKDPSGVNVKFTKDGYIELRTSDNYIWKNKLPMDVEIDKATCTYANKCLSLKFPKKLKEKLSENSTACETTKSK